MHGLGSLTITILRAFVAATATFSMSSVAFAAECLDYEPAILTLQGRASLKPAYGPPGFGEDPKHDVREDYLALTLDTPVCMKPSPEPHSDNIAETGIKTIQLVLRDGETFRKTKRWVGKRIVVRGSLYHGFSGHHHTTVLMTVERIE